MPAVKIDEPKHEAIIRDSAGLRDALFDEIDAIRSGKGNPTRANAVAKIAAVIVDSVRADIEVKRFLMENAVDMGTKEIARELEKSEIPPSQPNGALGVPVALGRVKR